MQKPETVNSNPMKYRKEKKHSVGITPKSKYLVEVAATYTLETLAQVKAFQKLWAERKPVAQGNRLCGSTMRVLKRKPEAKDAV